MEEESNKVKRKVLFLRVTEPLYDRIMAQAQKEDLKINPMATILLKKGLRVVGKEVK